MTIRYPRHNQRWAGIHVYAWFQYTISITVSNYLRDWYQNNDTSDTY